MLQYPKEYNLLNEEELEYTGGGSDANVALVGIGFVGNIVCALASNAYRGAISKKLKEKDPEKYQPAADGSVWPLAQDTLKTYFTSVGGILITFGTIASFGCIAAGTVMQ